MLSATVYVIDDDAASRQSLATALAGAGYHVETYVSAEAFLAVFQHDPSRPRCMVAEVQLPGVGGLALQEQLRRDGIRMPVIFITSHTEVTAAVQAMKAGACDYLLKPVDMAALLDCVTSALEHDARRSAKAVRNDVVKNRLSRLTPREREVLDLLVNAQSTKEIAAQLNINAKTVFVHRARVMEKMSVESLVELSRLMAEMDGPA